MIGLVRGFRYPYVRENIYKNLIYPLEKYGFEVDIFWHTYDIEYDEIIKKMDKVQRFIYYSSYGRYRRLRIS
tara:strand:- start:132 stop:347 length:216 start_codon:yes stop_codon:yes gene_type:complete